MPTPRITFGMIVLNGEPFLRYNLRALYPFAHEIIVVEGACHGAASAATADGHSIDGTLDTLRDFQRHHDPENKVIVVTAEQDGHSNGFWPGEKHEQSQAYARRAKGDWLWQVDVDEFYKPADIETVVSRYLNSSEVATVSFRQIQFWGNIDTLVDGWYLRFELPEIHRIFRWAPGFEYVTHRPPTVTDRTGEDLREKGWIRGNELVAKGIYMYHYSSVFPSQVRRKSAYYSAASWAHLEQMNSWYSEVFEALSKPYRVHNVYQYPSWLERFRGSHPPVIIEMWKEECALTRPSPDTDYHRLAIERLLTSPRYRFGVMALKAIGPAAIYSQRIALRAFRRMPPGVQATVRLAIWPWVNASEHRL
jgi:hypothetical protein